MKRPNGYGSITKMPGKRRKPWAVRVTEDVVNTKEGQKQIRKYIGTYATRMEAEARLVEYNQGLINLERVGVSFKEVKELWEQRHYLTVGSSTIQGYDAAFKLWEPLHEIPFSEIRHRHLQDILNNTNKSYSTKSNMKVLVGLMYKYALVNDIILKDYSETLVIGKNQVSTLHKPFTEDEIKRLFRAISVPFVDVILIQIHTGMRTIEITGELTLRDGYLVGGSKTAAGRDRIIPLHKNIESLVLGRFKTYGKLLEDGLTSDSYRRRFKEVMDELGMDHLPHDARHTFATVMNRTDANQLAVKRILGHSGTGVTEQTYTHKDINDLKEAVSHFPDYSFKASLRLVKTG